MHIGVLNVQRCKTGDKRLCVEEYKELLISSIMFLSYIEVLLITYIITGSFTIFSLLIYILHQRKKPLIQDYDYDEYVFNSDKDGIIIMNDSYHNRK